AKSVEFLLSSGAGIVGLRNAYFYMPHSKLYLYTCRSRLPYALGATQCYYKSLWAKQPFKAISHGEDLYFQHGNIIKSHSHKQGFAAIIHKDNVTGTKKYRGASYTPLQKEFALSILGQNYHDYPMP